MANLQTTISLRDQVSDRLNTMANAAQATTQAFDNVSQASAMQTDGISAAQAEANRFHEAVIAVKEATEKVALASQDVDFNPAVQSADRVERNVRNIETPIINNEKAQGRFNQAIEEGERNANSLKRVLKGVAAALSVRAIHRFMSGSVDLANQQIHAEQRLATVAANRGIAQEDYNRLLEHARNLQARTTFDDSAIHGATSELARSMRDVGAIEIVLDAVVDMAAYQNPFGATAGDMAGIAQYFTQAMEGNYRMLERRAGIHLSEMQSQVMKYGSDMERALVISDVVNASWGGLAETMARTPQGMREQMRNTFDDIRGEIGAQLLPAIMTVFNTIQENMPIIKQVIEGIVPIIQNIIMIIGRLVNIAFQFASVVIDNWSWIRPILLGVVAALLLWKGVTMAATIAQKLFNLAKLKSPKTWIILAIMAIVAAIVLWTNHMNKSADEQMSVLGNVVGVFAAVGAFLINHFVLPIQRKFAMFANFFGNLFNNPIEAIKVLFFDMALYVLRILQNLADGALSAINWIPGVNVEVTGLNNAINNLTKRRSDIIANSGYRVFVEPMENIDLSDAFEWGYGIGERLENMFDTDIEVPEPGDFVDTSRFEMGGHIPINVQDIADNTGAMVGMGEENLKWLRDIAERDAVNRFTTAEINVDLGGVTNNVNSNTDLAGLVEYIGDAVAEQLWISAEGVHA